MTILLSALVAWFVVNAAFVAYMVRASRADRSELERPVVERSFKPVERSFGPAAFSRENAMGDMRARR